MLRAEPQRLNRASSAPDALPGSRGNADGLRDAARPPSYLLDHVIDLAGQMHVVRRITCPCAAYRRIRAHVPRHVPGDVGFLLDLTKDRHCQHHLVDRRHPDRRRHRAEERLFRRTVPGTQTNPERNPEAISGRHREALSSYRPRVDLDADRHIERVRLPAPITEFIRPVTPTSDSLGLHEGIEAAGRRSCNRKFGRQRIGHVDLRG
jgi:hypothetical protein